MKKVLAVLFFFSIAGCATIPKNASVLSSSVSQGIERLQTENEKIINALADIERAILDEEWDNLYNEIEAKYRAKYSIPNGTALTRDQTIDIATGAAAVREELLHSISEKEQALILKSRENTEKVVSINKEVQNYLLSLEEYNDATAQVNELTQRITGINPSDILGTIDTNMQNAINNYLN